MDNQNKPTRRIFTIDGMYFANRALGVLNMKDSVNNLETDFELEAFRATLNRHIIDLYVAFSPYIDNIIMVNDKNSWRKEITPYRPYYIPESNPTPIGYKENRKAKKDESPINYKNFYKVFAEFIEDLKTKMIVFDIQGLEGDDVLLLLSQKVVGLQGIELMLFCTDGDITQVVNDNVFLMRNIRSKEAPVGEFVINHKKYSTIFEQDARSQLLGGSTLDINYYKQLFGMQIYSKTTVERSLGRGIEIATPFKIALIKSICGDKKDNIFSILGWTAGSKNYKITENHINKALKMDNLYLTEGTAQKLLTTKDMLVNLLINLRVICKQEHVDLNEMGRHLKHNLRMIVLTAKNIPEQYILNFETVWEQNKDNILNGTFDDSKLVAMNVNSKDSATNLLENSIPDDIQNILNS